MTYYVEKVLRQPESVQVGSGTTLLMPHKSRQVYKKPTSFDLLNNRSIKLGDFYQDRFALLAGGGLLIGISGLALYAAKAYAFFWLAGYKGWWKKDKESGHKASQWWLGTTAGEVALFALAGLLGVGMITSMAPKFQRSGGGSGEQESGGGSGRTTSTYSIDSGGHVTSSTYSGSDSGYWE